MCNNLCRTLIAMLGMLIAASCNVAKNKGKIAGNDSAKNSSAMANEAKMENLLRHFKVNNNFPVIFDSIHISTINKQDSLGTNEVKMLAKKMLADSLNVDTTWPFRDFYMIDSLKANHAYKKWLANIKDYTAQPKQSNAYGLQRVTLADGTTLLIWAFVYSEEEADPIYNISNIYFTVVHGDTIGETFLLGYDSHGMDPPTGFQTILSSKLTNDGKLVMEDNDLAIDIDTTVAELNHTHYEYSISKGNVALKVKKRDSLKHIPMKKEE